MSLLGVSNPTGVGRGLNYIGDYAYAFSGRTGASTSLNTRFDFTTGNSIFVGELTGMGAVNMDTGDLASGYITGWEIFFNGEAVAGTKVDSAQEDQPNEFTIPLIIPPFTHVEIKNISNGTDANRQTSTMLTGRVY